MINWLVPFWSPSVGPAVQSKLANEVSQASASGDPGRMPLWPSTALEKPNKSSSLNHENHA
jgi:hypothetical protein